MSYYYYRILPLGFFFVCPVIPLKSDHQDVNLYESSLVYDSQNIISWKVLWDRTFSKWHDECALLYELHYLYDIPLGHLEIADMLDRYVWDEVPWKWGSKIMLLRLH